MDPSALLQAGSILQSKLLGGIYSSSYYNFYCCTLNFKHVLQSMELHTLQMLRNMDVGQI